MLSVSSKGESMHEATEQVRILKRMVVCGVVFLVAFAIMGVCLALFGDKQIGEPSVTAKDIPDLAAIFTLVITMVGSWFYLKHLASRHDEEFEAVELEASADEVTEEPATTFERFHVVMWVSTLAFLWPDKWKPVPEPFNYWWTGAAAVVVAGVVLAITVRAWRKLHEIENA